MNTLAARLKALGKALEQGKELPPEVLERLEACLEEIDNVLPPARRGRPKQPELSWLRFTVDMIKRLSDGRKTDRAILQGLLKSKTDQEVVQRMLGGHRGSLKTLQNKLAQARKARR